VELKEFLYVDVDRTRSLLAQMAGGVTSEVRERTSNDFEGRVQATFLGVGAGGQYVRGSQHEEARSLQDLTFVQFERLANENGLITELGPEVMDQQKWQSGEVHRGLLPGQLARVECYVHLLDGSVFQKRIERFIKLAEAITELSLPPQSSGGGSQRTRQRSGGGGGGGGTTAARKGATAAILGATPESMMAVSSAVDAVVGNSVSMRILPCGPEALECSFSGSLLGRREYLQEERENLFSRYGQAPSVWTSVFQIAAIPIQSDSFVEPEVGTGWTTNANQLNRARMEADVNRIMDFMEQMGVFEGPRWPSISVTPLGLYRTLPES
jgi:hypothetical protein